MQPPPPPYQKMANRIDLDLDLEAGSIITQQPTAHPVMAYGKSLFPTDPHIECDGCGKCCECKHTGCGECEHNGECKHNGCGECTHNGCGGCGTGKCECKTSWGVLILVMVVFLLALWLFRRT